jgi:aldehyde oxidoreductase
MKKISLAVNGFRHEFIVEPDYRLIDLLRKDLNLTGTKQGCDRKGQCGACMVIVNKKTAFSCLTKIADLHGADVITVEGLGTPENPHLIQEAFVLSGAIQCGFCTPGMIMATKALLDINTNPTVDDIKRDLRHNLCRCTGYKKIIEAVQLAAKFVRGEITPDMIRPKQTDGVIGVSHPRPSALAKACGTAHFTADVRLEGALELAVLRSPIAHGRIINIDTSQAERMSGVVGILRAVDIKGTNILKFAVSDRPVLCGEKVHCVGDPIVVVAAENKEQADVALEAIQVDFEPLPSLESPEASLANDAIRIHPELANLCVDQPMVKGNAVEALNNSAAVIEARFTTQRVHVAPLEPEATVAYWEDEEKGEDAVLVIIGRSIFIHHHLAMLQDALGWENMKYLEAYTGGQFGIKLDVMSEGIAGAAAIHFRRPVRYVPSTAESILMTSKRHAFDMHIKLGADSKGKLTTYCNDIIMDKGAYSSANIFDRAFLSLSGSYNIPNVDARIKVVYTNNPFGSAARGAGQPQVAFALECAMDMLADKLGIDPYEFRLQNSLEPGQTKCTGYIVEEWPFPQVMEAIRPHYQRAVKEATPYRTGRIRRGVGMAAGAHGVGRTGEGAVAAIELDSDGGISVYAAAADPGEGSDSMLSQIVAHVMNIPLDKVRLFTRDTDLTSMSGPAAGSRLTFMIGGALVNALQQLKEAMEETGARNLDELLAAGKPKRYLGSKKNGDARPMDPKTGQGPAYVTDIHGVQMVEIEIDAESGEVTILKMTTAVDAGTIINPQNVTGQLEGGMDMGVGYALREEYIPGKTTDWFSLKFPSIRQSFEMETILVETPRAQGPLGATGVGEMCMVPTAPAVINAIKNATGVWICDLPATPEKIKASLMASKK